MSVVSAKLSTNLTLSQTPTSGFLAGQGLIIPELLAVAFANGTGSDAVNLISPTTLNLVASTPQTIDLTSLLDIQGNAVSFSKVQLLLLRNNATTAGFNCTVGNAASNAFSAIFGATGMVTLYPGTATNPFGGFNIYSIPGNVAAVDSTHKNLKFDPGSNSFTVDVLIIGQ